MADVEKIQDAEAKVAAMQEALADVQSGLQKAERDRSRRRGDKRAGRAIAQGHGRADRPRRRADVLLPPTTTVSGRGA